MSEKHDKLKNKENKINKEKKESSDDNDDDNSINKLNINEEYAERFQHNEKRKKEEKLRNKYGVNIKNRDEEENTELEQGSESPEESEDSEGELDNEVVRDKFINTLLELKDENETKKLLENKAPIFTDDDFTKKREKVHKKEKQDKIEYGIKDALLDNKSSSGEEDEASENNIYSIHYKPKKIVEDQTEKNAFISAANEEISENSEHSDNDNDFFDNGLLVKKKGKPTNLLNLEENNNDNNKEVKEETPEQAEEKIAGMSLTDVLNKSKINPNNVNMSLLKQIWGDDKKLSKDERFLRNYILSEGWLDKTTTGLNKNLLLIDKEDEENEDKFDAFENKYNHRFEEEGGANITTYQRNIDSYRHKDDTRAIKRKEHDIRKQEEKNKKKEEIKIVIEEKNKNIQELQNKKKEIIQKIDKEIKDKLKEINIIKKKSQKEINLLEKNQKKLYETANSIKIKLGIIQPQSKINPKQKPNKKQDNITSKIQNKKEELKNKVKKVKEEEKKEEIKEIKKEVKKEEIKEIKDNKKEIQEIKEEEEIIHEDYACDGCEIKPIKGARYHCETCPDYDLCKKCYFSDIKKSHNHSFICINKPQKEEKKEKIIIDKIHKNISCNKCRINPIKGIRYKCGICYNFDFCENCEKNYGKEHGHPMLRLPWDNMIKNFKCKMKNNLNNKNTNIFEGINCNKCGKNNIEGIVFKCNECKDYYLCEQCINGNPFEHLHPLIKIYSPNMNIESVNIVMINNYY